MKYSPLAVHCTSLCLDVIYDEKFLCLNPDDIRNYYSDIYQMVYERIYSKGLNNTHLVSLSALVTRKILLVLIYYLHHPTEVEPGRMLYEMNDAIGSFSS